MKFYFALLLVATAVTLATSQKTLYQIISDNNFTDEKHQEDLLLALQADQIESTTTCLIRPTSAGCDARYGRLANVIKAASDFDYKCQDCPIAMKFFIVYVKQAIAQRPDLCKDVIKNLGIRNPGC